MFRIDGITLRKLRIAYNLTQRELAALCDVTAGMINKIERGKYPMTDSVKVSLIRELSLSAEKISVLLSEYERIESRKRAARDRAYNGLTKGAVCGVFSR